MKTKEFLTIIENHSDKHLIFEYAPTKWVGANYHITEVKNTSIDSVDCGGKSDAWQETVVQLWEDPMGFGKRVYMKTQKALDIFNRVDGIKPLLLDTDIKFEYGNKEFHTAQLKVNNFEIIDDKLVFKLHTYKTDCKAKSECSPVKKVIKQVTECCSPTSGCC
jgi:hypothetical protein